MKIMLVLCQILFSGLNISRFNQNDVATAMESVENFTEG